MKLGPVHLSVADLSRSIDYYERSIGLELLGGGASGASGGGASPGEPASGGSLGDTPFAASLGVGGRVLLRLLEAPGARPSRHCSGLYHVALLVPSRVDLARWVSHAISERVRIAGVADHFVSEAIYLTDPDGHGIEIYADRPRAIWEGQVAQRMTTLPLDIEGLLSELPHPASGPFHRLPAGTTIGHVHLKVCEIGAAIAFYRDVLGFDLVLALDGQAAFLSLGGYHHHIGVNTWESAGRGQPPEGFATLLAATLRLPTEEEVDRIADRAAGAGGGRGGGAGVHRAAGAGVRRGGGDGVSRAVGAGSDVFEADGGVLLHDPSGNPILLTAG